MDPGFRSPLIDFFRRGDVASDIRQLAAQGAFAPRAIDQVALLLILHDDPDPAVSATARATIGALPAEAVARFIGRKDVPEQMRAFFTDRDIQPVEGATSEDEPLLEEDTAGKVEEESSDPKILSSLSVKQRIKLAMKGSREQRSQLVRDSNKVVAMAVLSSPKITDAEIEAYARMANLSEDVLRVIGTNRAWTKNYNVIAGLAKNPKTPPAVSMRFLQRLNARDLKMLAIDRNAPEAVRLAARKYVAQK